MKFLLMMTVLVSACGPGQGIRWNSSFSLPAGENGSVHRGVAGPVTGIIGDRLVVAGGANFPEKMPWEGGTKEHSRLAYIYAIGENGIRLTHRQLLKVAVSYPGNCPAEGAFYVAGGEDSRGPLNIVMRITLENDSLITESLPPLPVPLTNGSLVFASGKLYFAGGENRELVSDKVYAYDLSGEDGGWKEAFRLPYPVSNAVVVSDGKNKIYIAGGRRRNENAVSTFYDGVLEADLVSGDIRRIATLPEASAAGTGVLDREGNILLFGGDTGETFHKVEALNLQIGRTIDPERSKELNEQKARVQRSHPGFSKVCRKYDLKKKKWVSVSPVPGDSPVTTTALVYRDLIIIPSGEIRAGVRTDQILVGIVNDQKTYEK